ncbi:MlaD family protein [Antarcticirhabdus aurantiaca]|uniref:MlaD family protein n=1 Tax=Antarcticirhabdus aurantiaca TaxID=2606717 RepID=A0ACD4NV50_9HYPH|nr:MlaD family protein [Antarcticirhabdus aurantiaca]WAJ30669.1 MlaD family protein [Jeongeuplla avenae]
METRANYVRVGLFTIVVLLLAIGFTYWAVFSQRGSERIPLIVRIEGSVQGLQQGSQVLFNGLPVGLVTSLRIDPNNPRVVIANTEIDPGVPIRTSTEASLGIQGLTGFAFIGLRGGRTDDRDIVASALEQGTVPVITARPSEVTDILATARDIADRTNSILGEFENLVGTLSPSVRTTVENVAATSENVNRFTASLANNSDDIDNFLDSLGQLANTANTVAEGLPETIAAARAVIEAVNPVQVSAIVSNAERITGNLSTASDDVSNAVASVRGAADSFRAVGEAISSNTAGIDRFLANLGPLSDSATSVAARLDTTLADAGRIVAAVNADQVSAAVENISGIARTINDQSGAIASAIENVSGASQSVANLVARVDANRDSIDEALSNVGPISRDVASAARRIDSAAEEANRLVAAIDADRVNAVVGNVDTLTAGIAAKTSEIQSVIDGVNRTIGTVDSVIAGFDGTRQAFDRILVAFDAERLNAAIGNVSAATDNVAVAADQIASVARDIGNRREDINSVITNAQLTSQRVAAASARLDGVVSSLGRVFEGGPGSGGLGIEISQTLAAIRDTARNFQANLDPIAANIERFSGQGLREVQTLVRDVTQSVNRIDRAVSDFSADPSRLIYGGEEVKQYDGRTRR